MQLAAKGTELADMNGDGIVDLVSKLAPGTGDFVYFPNRGSGDWGSATRFQNNPAFSFEDPGVRLIDFDGDGLVDVMQTTPTEYFYFRNNGDGSWADPTSGPPIAAQPIVFSDPQVRLADMNGDRLIDLVYVRAGSVVYWPSLGWGRWGDAVSVGGAPNAGADQVRVQLADMNGDGLADLWLASGTELRIWLQRGDGTFAAPVAFSGLPDANPLTTFVRVADMNGSGTADVVWNDPTAAADQSWRYLDLTGGVRPNLLATIDNGMGRTIQIDYSSTGTMFRMAAAAGTALDDAPADPDAGRRLRDDERRSGLVQAGGLRLPGTATTTRRRASSAASVSRRRSSRATTRRRPRSRSTRSTWARPPRRSRASSWASRFRTRQAPSSGATRIRSRFTPTARAPTAGSSRVPIGRRTSSSTSRGPPHP